jgi:Protein of unknown function (DUF1501)
MKLFQTIVVATSGEGFRHRERIEGYPVWQAKNGREGIGDTWLPIPGPPFPLDDGTGRRVSVCNTCGQRKPFYSARARRMRPAVRQHHFSSQSTLQPPCMQNTMATPATTPNFGGISMLNLLGSTQRFCDGLTRRSFLKIGAFGTGLTLADMLRAKASHGVEPRGSHATPTAAKSAIMIYLPGGPSHMDMYDLKPDAPMEYRGEFRPIQTNVAGVQISEHFPRQARMFDKLAVIRSIVTVDEHSDSMVMTGYSENTNRTAHHPSIGAVASRLRGTGNAEIPPFVSLYGMTVGNEPGYLGVAHRPFTPGSQGNANLTLAPGVNRERSHDRRQLLENFDSLRRDLDATGTMRGMDTFQQRAFDMVASGATRRALDVAQEDPRSRDRYRGLDPFLTARRLVEAGVGCVTLAFGGWDTHDRNFIQLRTQLPDLDRGIANLVQDLHDRGMERDTVVVVWGEFGRTPRINGTAGRDHWAPVMSALVAGGGLRMGQAIGSSSARGEQPRDRRCTASQVLSTVYRAMGIDPSMTFPNGSGRPMYILDDREPVSELLS